MNSRPVNFQSRLWDPATGEFQKVPTPSDMFCGGHAFLPDGKLLIAGGTGRYEKLGDNVHVSAGVMTVSNRSRRHSVLVRKGTAFVCSEGRLYRATADGPRVPAAGRGRTASWSAG